MKKKSKLFGTAGIRGRFGTKVTAELVIQVSQTVAKIYSSEGILVGHDARTSSEALSQFAEASLSLSGVTVHKIGLCTFPVIANLTLNPKHSVAIYITASHNPPTDNGIKVLREGREFTLQEQNQIEDLIFDEKENLEQIHHEDWDKIQPQLEILDANDQYFKRITKEIKIDGGGRKVILDCANGPMANLAPLLLTHYGFLPTTINSHIDGSFPGRLAEPSPENLSTLIDLCKKEQVLGVAFDGDGDRLAIIDEQGNFVELSRINALLATYAIEEEGPGKVIVSIDSSTTIDKTVEKIGGEIIRTNLGELHTKGKELLEANEKVVFAAEPWKPIFPKWGFWIDGLYSLTKILKVIISSQTTVSEIIKSVPLHIAKRSAYMVDQEKVEAIFDDCKTKLKDSLIDESKKELTIDGLRYDMDDSTWILIRKSGTEPKIRIYYESPTEERFEWIASIVKDLEKIIRDE
jgi:phosphomannomutase